MRLPDNIVHSAVFLGYEDRNGIVKMAGTAFFVGIESESRPGVDHGYLVTAKHCVERAKRQGSLLLRLNRHDGNHVATSSETDSLPDSWVYHDDEANDVAVLYFAPPPSEFLFVITKRESMATPDVIAEEQLGIGDDLAVVGLFTKRSGKTVNRPIVRSGIISSMPDEPLQDRDSGLNYDGYLAEVRSIGGLSGSPVWTVISPGRFVGDRVERHRLHFYLLGLIRGHWPKEEFEIGDVLDDERESLNTGIAIVTPIQKVLDILDSEEMRKERRKVDREQVEASALDEPDSGDGDADAAGS